MQWGQRAVTPRPGPISRGVMKRRLELSLCSFIVGLVASCSFTGTGAAPRTGQDIPAVTEALPEPVDEGIDPRCHTEWSNEDLAESRFQAAEETFLACQRLSMPPFEPFPSLNPQIRGWWSAKIGATRAREWRRNVGNAETCWCMSPTAA